MYTEQKMRKTVRPVNEISNNKSEINYKTS